MKQGIFTVEHTRRLTADVWELVLSGDASGISTPGQFVGIALPGRTLRRPFGVCSWTEGGILLIVKEAGAGTRDLVRMPPGTPLDLLTGLGNGFDLSRIGERTILAGGGIGLAPLYGLAKALRERGIRPVVALGFRDAAGAFYLEDLAALGCDLMVSTEDGSLGIRGTVTDLIRERPERTDVVCCGPLPMLRAVHGLAQIRTGQYSFEARMGCGFGACMGCSMPTVHGPRRVCKDGPVFFQEEILWQT